MPSETTKTVYLNHAGTSWPKPKPVTEALNRFASSDPGEWPHLFKTAFRTVADFFHVDQSRLLITPSCTAALQLAMMDHDWKIGDRVLSSQFEHHAISRNLSKLTELGVEVVKIPYGKSDLVDLDLLESELKNGNVKLVAMTAACNVTGRLLPATEVIHLAHQYNSLVLIDGAQIAGWWDLDLKAFEADFFTFAGHKGPQAPWGVGGLYVAPETEMNCCFATCDLVSKPDRFAMPGYCDSGSVNLPALLGMAAGCQALANAENASRLNASREFATIFANQVRQIPGVAIYHDVPAEMKMPSVAIDVEGMKSAEVAKALRDKGIIVSGGFQCSPDSHQALETAEKGLTRFSFAPTNSAADVEFATKSLMELRSRLGG